MSRSQEVDYEQHKARMNQLIETYSYRYSVPKAPKSAGFANVSQSSSTTDNIVLVTGTTGNVGSELLYLLLIDSRISKIYALNRHSNEGSSRERIKKQLQTKSLPTHVLSSPKVVFIDGKLDDLKLGLSPAMYDELQKNVTTVVHNAWSVNLAQPIDFFIPSIRGLFNLITLARGSSHGQRLRFLFISSVAAVSRWLKFNGNKPIPEDLHNDMSSSVGLGYGESKYVAEAILARSGLNATFLRFYQMCGRQADGTWAPGEWPPLFLKASLLLGIKTEFVGPVPLIPADLSAHCIRDIAVETRPLPMVLNFRHPKPVPWKVFSHAVERLLPKNQIYPTMHSHDFAHELKRARSTATRAEIRQNPILGLAGLALNQTQDNKELLAREGPHPVTHFLHGTMDIDKALEFSPSLKEARPISPREAEAFVEYWQRIGFFPSSQALVTNYREMAKL